MRHQRGISEIIVLVILAAVLCTAALGALTVYNHSIERAKVAELRAEKAEKSASDQRAENATIKATVAATEAVRVSRQGYNVKQADIERMVASAIQNVYANSPDARKWANTPVPADVNASVLANGSETGRDKVIPGAIAEAGNKPNPGSGVASAANQRSVAGPRNPLQRPAP